MHALLLISGWISVGYATSLQYLFPRNLCDYAGMHALLLVSYLKRDDRSLLFMGLYYNDLLYHWLVRWLDLGLQLQVLSNRALEVCRVWPYAFMCFCILLCNYVDNRNAFSWQTDTTVKCRALFQLGARKQPIEVFMQARPWLQRSGILGTSSA
jgi:hypothetical protein